VAIWGEKSTFNGDTSKRRKQKKLKLVEEISHWPQTIDEAQAKLPIDAGRDAAVRLLPHV